MFNITAMSIVENALKRKQTDFTTQTHANFKKTAPQLIANEKRCPNNRRWHDGEQQVHNEKRPIFATSERTFETVPCFLHGDRFTQKIRDLVWSLTALGMILGRSRSCKLAARKAETIRLPKEVDGVIGDMIRGRWHLCRNYEASKRLAELGGSALLCFDGTTSERKGIDHNCGKLNQKMMTNGHHEAIPPLGTVQIVDKTAATQATANQATVSQLRELAGEFDESAGFADKMDLTACSGEHV